MATRRKGEPRQGLRLPLEEVARRTGVKQRRRGRPGGPGFLKLVEPDDDDTPSWRAIVMDHDYDENAVYTRAVDDKGHMDRVNLAMPQGTMHLLRGVVNELRYYDSIPAFIRDAIFHHLNRLARVQIINPDLQQMIDMETALANLNYKRESMRIIKAAVAEFAATLKEAEGDWIRFEGLIDQGDVVVEKLTEPYRGQLEKVLRDAREVYKRNQP